MPAASVEQPPLSLSVIQSGSFGSPGYEASRIGIPPNSHCCGDLDLEVVSRAPQIKQRQHRDKDVAEWMCSVLQWQAIQLGTGRRRQVKKRRLSVDGSSQPNPRVVDLPLPQRDGSVDFKTVVTWSGGRAVAARRAETRRAFRDRFKQPGMGSTASWASVSPVAVWGDFRNNPGRYIYQEPSLTALEVPDPVGTWKAVLACAQALEGFVSSVMASGESDDVAASTDVIYLSQLVRFVDYSRRLPRPEVIFHGSQAAHMVEAIATAFHELLGFIQKARHHQAKLMDAWSVEACADSLHAEVKAAARALYPLRLDETEEWLEQCVVVSAWQRRLDSASQLRDSEGQLEILQALEQEATASHGFCCASLVQLRLKLQKCTELRHKIRDWREDKRPKTPKWIATAVRDVQRLQIHFPELSDLLNVNAQAVEWVERANIAIRSRLSLDEVQHLLTTPLADVLQVDDLKEKLQSRVDAANEWLEQVAAVVPFTTLDKWMEAVRNKLEAGLGSELHELACQGGRLPVQVPSVQLLQVELEARTWKQKAIKWIPDDASSRRGKLEDIKEHVEKARALRERLVLPSERKAWVLPGEDTLKCLVDQAQAWLDMYDSIGDKCLSLQALREISEQGDAIHVNLSPATSKVSKALVQAQEWYGKYADLLGRVRGTPTGENPVALSELKSAVDAAEADLPIELLEATELQQVLTRVEIWQGTVAVATGGKPRRSKKGVLTIQDLVWLIEEASFLPVDTREDVLKLQRQLQSVKEWQGIAGRRIEEIRAGLDDLRNAMDDTYGSPANYVRKHSIPFDEPGDTASESDDMDVDDSDAVARDASSNDTASSSGAAGSDVSSLDRLRRCDSRVRMLIEALSKEAGAIPIATPESESVSTLEAAVRWCSRSLKYLENQRDIFDKRFFGAFDRFFSEQHAISTVSSGKAAGGAETAAAQNLQLLCEARTALVGDQLQRLTIILSDREEYILWCKSAEALILDSQKPTLEKLKDLTAKSQAFPGTSELVHKVRKLAEDAAHWAEKTGKAMMTETKITLSEAKALCDEGDKLGIQCIELRQLRSALKTARRWANRVKRSKLDQGTTQVKVIQALLDEHDELLVEMPEEVAKLKQVAKNYCLCRRPYEGFMVGCDECAEWYHGSCIGVSESKADKCEKYVCVRCCVARTFKSCATTVVKVIRKWTCEKDLKRARQHSTQKHKNKVRHEAKLMKKLRKQEAELVEDLEKYRSIDKILETPKTDDRNETEAVGSGDLDGFYLAAPATDDCGSSKLIIAPPQESRLACIQTVNGGPSCHESASMPLSSEIQGDPTVKAKPKSVPIVETAGKSNEEVEAVILIRLGKVADLVHRLESRLAQSEKGLVLLQQTFAKEDGCGPLLRKWCIRVRSLVLAPMSLQRSTISRPNADGTLSAVMVSLMDEAHQFGLLGFQDVMSVRNAFACLGWTIRAAAVLCRQPSLFDVESLLCQGSSIALPNEKVVKILKPIVQRACAWQSEVARVLTPIPGESRPYNLDILRGLANAGSDLPLGMPFESRLLTVIEDKGMRHCICGGPSDGRFMLSCDECDRWFHGHCVGISKEVSNNIDDWKCPSCTGCSNIAENLDLGKFHENFEVDNEKDSASDDDDDDVSSKAPKPDDMWPPFGLLNSTKATEALGEVCSAIPDSTDEWKVEEPHAAALTEQNVPLIRTDSASCPLHG
jgi:hypothetical protein